MALQAEVDAKQAEALALDQARQVAQRKQAIAHVGEGFEYIFGEKPESTTYEAGRAIAHMDDLRFVRAYDHAVMVLKVLCTCKACGEDFESWEGLGQTKNHYSAARETKPEDRRKYAIERLVKLQQRNYQPNGYGHDHTCYEGSLLVVLAAARMAAKKRGVSTMTVLDEVARLPEQW